MGARPGLLVIVHPKTGIAVPAKTVARAATAGALRPDGDDAGHAQRRQRLLIETARHLGVAHGEFHVIQ